MLKPVGTNWLRTLAAPHGTFSAGVFVRVFVFGLAATAVWLLHRNGTGVASPVGYHEVAGAIVALSLALRANTAHTRFWEGRTILGALVNASRNLARLMELHARLEPTRARTVAKWIVIFAHVTRRRLRDQKRSEEIDIHLTEEEITELRAARHPSLHVASKITALIREAGDEKRMSDMLVAQAEGLLATMVDCLGGCERIKKTPTAFGFMILVRRCIVIFLATLPFALVKELGPFTIVATVLVAYPTLMIEAIANELDDPFGTDPNDLAVSRICAGIELDLLGSEPPPSGAPPYLDD